MKCYVKQKWIWFLKVAHNFGFFSVTLGMNWQNICASSFSLGKVGFIFGLISTQIFHSFKDHFDSFLGDLESFSGQVDAFKAIFRPFLIHFLEHLNIFESNSDHFLTFLGLFSRNLWRFRTILATNWHKICASSLRESWKKLPNQL